jgi:diamine N-acetyltransferase
MLRSRLVINGRGWDGHGSIDCREDERCSLTLAVLGFVTLILMVNPAIDSIQIRRGVLEDAPALAALAARTFADAFAADNRPEDLQAHLESSYGLEQQSRELSDPNEITLLVFAAETLIAFAQVRRKFPPECVTQAQAIEVHRFYVDRLAHGKGVAQSLMTAVKSAAQEFDAQHLWLSAWERNPRAVAFYTKMGFKIVGDADFVVGSDVQTDHIMVAQLLPEL